MTENPPASQGQAAAADNPEAAELGMVSDADELVARILELTKSPQSALYYQKAISTMGLRVVEEELGELRYQMQTGSVDAPAKYFTTLLQKRFALNNTRAGAAPAVKTKPEPYNAQSYQNATALELFGELKPLPQRDGDSTDEGAMEIPYSSKTLPWATFIGPDFFTLSTNKAKSDRVIAKFRMLDGKLAEVPLYRGRFFPQDEERGILTTEEGRILGAMETFWVDQGCRYAKFGNGAVACYCDVGLRELARVLGWESFGGKDLVHLKRKATNLKVKGYYLELESLKEFRDAGLRGYGFSLVDGFDVLEKVRHRREQTVIRVRFSDPFSRQLLARRVVSRPKELLQIRSELAFLVRLYIEPILMSRGVGGSIQSSC